MTTAQQDQHDPRFDEAESGVERGTPWMFREADAPNPLTFVASGWSTGHTSLGPAEFLNGVDREGKLWSVLVGSVVLKKRLIEGLVESWDDEREEYVVTDVLGRVQIGEAVSIKFTGDKQGAQFEYPTFRVSRIPPASAAESEGGLADDDIRF